MKKFAFIGKETKGSVLATNFKEACSMLSKVMFNPRSIIIDSTEVTIGETIAISKHPIYE